MGSDIKESMKKYDVLLFDLDGTLTDSGIGITRSVQYALARFGIHEENPDNLIKFIGPPLKESFSKYYGFADHDAWQAVRFYREYYGDKGIYENQVFPGVERMLADLLGKEVKMIVATSKPTPYTHIVLAHFGLSSYFDLVVGSNLDGSRVKKGEIISCALEEFPDYGRDRSLMVGDREYDIRGAGENGLDSVGVTYGFGSEEEFQAARPTYLVSSVEELRELLLSLT